MPRANFFTHFFPIALHRWIHAQLAQQKLTNHEPIKYFHTSIMHPSTTNLMSARERRSSLDLLPSPATSHDDHAHDLPHHPDRQS